MMWRDCRKAAFGSHTDNLVLVMTLRFISLALESLSEFTSLTGFPFLQKSVHVFIVGSEERLADQLSLTRAKNLHFRLLINGRYLIT